MTPQLDETFGQYPAFSILNLDGVDDESSRQVAAYLRSVRDDAERDAPVYFASDMAPNTSIKDVTSHTTELGLTRWESDVLVRFSLLQDRLCDEKPALLQHASRYEPPATAAQWRTLIFELSPPSMGAVLQFDRATVFRLVVYVTRWLSLSVNEHFSRWIWVLLSLVEKPLDLNESAIMHELGKKAQKLECKSHGSVIAQYTINFVRILVGHAFGQHDILERLRATLPQVIEEPSKRKRIL